MTVLHLGCLHGTTRVPLQLPATEQDVNTALSALQKTGEAGIIFIDSVTGPIPDIVKNISFEDISDSDTLEKLNRLSERIEQMGQYEREIYENMLHTTLLGGLGRILTAADTLVSFQAHDTANGINGGQIDLTDPAEQEHGYSMEMGGLS